MYLHFGGGNVIEKNDIIGIFDMDNTTVSRKGKDFLNAAQQKGKIRSAGNDLPLSFIVSYEKGESKVYLSPMSAKVLSRHAKTSKLIIQGY